MLLGEMSWPDLQTRTRDAYAIIPVGAVEPHGPHLPLASDTVISDYFAARLAHQINGLIAPSIGYGVATPSQRLGGDFPGVVNISGQTFTHLVTDVLTALARHGLRKFVIVNSAIDNVGFLCESARMLADDLPDARVMIVNWWDVVGEEYRNRLAAETGVARTEDHHAAMVESSLVMHIAPHATRPDLVPACPPPLPARRIAYHVFPLPADVSTESGVVYTASEAGAQLGERVAERVARELAAAVRLEFGESDER
ncbi:creatininase family protein [Spirillospora sp. NPDC052242]